jgi:hypothetical protein
MLGYKEADIQRLGGALNKALERASESERAGLLEVWDFFEGLLGEGYIPE